MLKPHLIYQLLFRTCSKQILLIFHQIREKLQVPRSIPRGRREGPLRNHSFLPRGLHSYSQEQRERMAWQGPKTRGESSTRVILFSFEGCGGSKDCWAFALPASHPPGVPWMPAGPKHRAPGGPSSQLAPGNVGFCPTIHGWNSPQSRMGPLPEKGQNPELNFKRVFPRNTISDFHHSENPLMSSPRLPSGGLTSMSFLNPFPLLTQQLLRSPPKFLYFSCLIHVDKKH